MKVLFTADLHIKLGQKSVPIAWSKSRFSRIQNVSKTDNKGLGLGLAISKSYVQMLGGTINVDSKLGFGSTFEFSIPFIYNQDNIDLNNLDSNIIIGRDLGEEELILVAEDENINYLIISFIVCN